MDVCVCPNLLVQSASEDAQEICCPLGSANGAWRGWSGGYEPTIGNALMFAGLVFQSFVLAGEPHYDVRVPVSLFPG
jgi:hypothetical protein